MNPSDKAGESRLIQPRNRRVLAPTNTGQDWPAQSATHTTGTVLYSWRNRLLR